MNIIVWAVKIILNLVVKEMNEMNDKQVFAYGMTLKVPEQDKLEFVAVCNLFDCYTMLNIPIDANVSINPKNVNSLKDFDFSKEFFLSIRGKYPNEQIKSFDEWRVK